MPLPPQNTVTIGLRPEQLRWAVGGEARNGLGIEANVQRVEHLGDVALVHCLVSGADELIIVKSALAPRELPAVNQWLWLQTDADRVLCFDAEGRLLAH